MQNFLGHTSRAKKKEIPSSDPNSSSRKKVPVKPKFSTQTLSRFPAAVMSSSSSSAAGQQQFRYTQTPSKVLHLRNLPWECAPEELAELCKPFGPIVDTKCNVGANRNQAFVEFVILISYCLISPPFSPSCDLFVA
jgi:RNA recognition motif-containing protein